MAFNPKKKLAQIMRAAKRLPKSPLSEERKQKYLEGQAKKMDRNPTLPESIFEEMLIRLKVKYETQKIIHGKIFDFYVPEKNMLLEVHGNYWHSYHLQIEEMSDIQKKIFFNDQKKKVLAEGVGYRIEYVWEHELDDEHYETTISRIKKLLS